MLGSIKQKLENAKTLEEVEAVWASADKLWVALLSRRQLKELEECLFFCREEFYPLGEHSADDYKILKKEDYIDLNKWDEWPTHIKPIENNV